MSRAQTLFRLFGKFYPEGTILHKEGEPGDEMFLIQSGAVRMAVGRREGGGETRGAGDVLGEEAFFDRAPRPCRAEVRSETRLLQVNDRNLDALVRNGPEIAFDMAEKLFDLASAVWDDLEAWILAHALQRAESLILGAGASGVRHGQIAEQTGIDPAEVLRLFVKLERLGGMTRDGEVFRIPDPNIFKRAARELANAGFEEPLS